MQIDGHHALTYIAARFAGFSHQKAAVIAYSAQYVDDATNEGVIVFDNGAMYSRIASAHKHLDHRNLDKLANHRVWLPFHFLPGNGGMAAGENPKGTFIQKLVCLPDSPVARDMLRTCVAGRDRPYALHRLGIAMHVYADTWTHQQFAGVNHKINVVKELQSNSKSLDRSFFNKIANYFISEAFPLGHGGALSHPDLPYLSWSYRNGYGKVIKRDNPIIFLQAVDMMCRAMQCYRNNDEHMELEAAEGLPQADAKKLLALLKGVKGESPEARHARWLSEIARGSFSFGKGRPVYKAKGTGSWKYRAIRQLAAYDTGREIFPYSPKFLHADWKLFHDALQAHRFCVVNDILPRYGICAA